MVDHTRSITVGCCFILKFQRDRIFTFGDIVIFILLAFWFETTYSCPLLGCFRRIFSSDDLIHHSHSERHLLAFKHIVWTIEHENQSDSLTWVHARDKRTGQSKKSWRCYISSVWRETLNETICTKIYTVVVIPNLITCAKFQTKIFRGHHFTGVKFLIFLLILTCPLQRASLICCLWCAHTEWLWSMPLLSR